MSVQDTNSKFRCYPNVFIVLFSSSRWRKASKCKRHVQNLLCSIKIHRRRRESMLRHAKSDIAQLLPDCLFSEAIPKAKQFYEDERRLSAYDQVEYLCTSLLENLNHLEYQSDVLFLPEETQAMMAGLIFAASRIGELKELRHIRSLFVERYGLVFDKECVDLGLGHLVSPKIIEILENKMPRDVIDIEIVKEKSKFLYSNLVESQGRDESLLMR
ncbi:unnamed protein product [Cochlearia groenlandica]